MRRRSPQQQPPLVNRDDWPGLAPPLTAPCTHTHTHTHTHTCRTTSQLGLVSCAGAPAAACAWVGRFSVVGQRQSTAGKTGGPGARFGRAESLPASAHTSQRGCVAGPKPDAERSHPTLPSPSPPLLLQSWRRSCSTGRRAASAPPACSASKCCGEHVDASLVSQCCCGRRVAAGRCWCMLPGPNAWAQCSAGQLRSRPLCPTIPLLQRAASAGVAAAAALLCEPYRPKASTHARQAAAPPDAQGAAATAVQDADCAPSAAAGTCCNAALERQAGGSRPHATTAGLVWCSAAAC